MQPEFLCHLPFLRLPPGTDEPLPGGGRLTALPCEEWLAIEDPAMDYHDRRYRTVQPAFVRTWLPDGAGVGELTAEQEQASEDEVERAHAAAILALPAIPIAPPSLSAAYVVWRGLPCDPPRNDGCFGPEYREPARQPEDEGIQLGRITVWLQQAPPAGGATEQLVVERRFGPAQREWLLSKYAAEADAVSPEQVRAYAQHHARLDRAGWGPRRAAALRCADVITIMTSPGVLLHEVIVLLVAALENLVNAAADKPLGDTFARRCAAWFAESPDERVRDQPRFRRLYGARSDILHGADPEAAVRDLTAAVEAANERDLHAWLRLHAWLAVDCLAGWYEHHPEDDGGASGFQTALAEAAVSADDQWQARRAQLLEGRTHVRR